MKKLYNGFVLFTFLAALFASCAPSMTQSQLAFGVWAAEQDLWSEAVFRWTRVLEENPSSIAALNNLAVAYEKLGRFEEAEQTYQAALKIAPKNPSVKANYEKFKIGWAETAEKAGGKNEKKYCFITDSHDDRITGSMWIASTCPGRRAGGNASRKPGRGRHIRIGIDYRHRHHRRQVF